MALVLIAFIGLSLFALFLLSLAKVASVILVATLKWTSVTILLTAFVLFILSGRIVYATLLVLAIGSMWLTHHRKKPPPPRRLPPPPIA